MFALFSCYNRSKCSQSSNQPLAKNSNMRVSHKPHSTLTITTPFPNLKENSIF